MNFRKTTNNTPLGSLVARRMLQSAFLVFLTGWILAGCASIGRPEGGPRDETPPVYVRSNPGQGALNVDRKRIEVYFDENIQLDDAFNKVVVSPAQKQAPVVRSLGHRVTVELRDSLVPDATYTIDFGDAIKDLNEGNILDGFALDFSTGDTIDSLRISGVLLDASNLEPAQGVLVGVYSNLSDTALTTLPLERVARTNSRGQFTVRGLKDIPYRVVAINDINRDNKWDKSEGIAFIDTPVVPSVESITVSDTLRSTAGQDSIVTRPGVSYLPADVLLTWFTEDFTTHYLKENSRPARNRVNLVLSAPYDSVPRATIVKTPALEGLDWNEITVADITPGNDTVTWWIKDKQVVDTDSLTLAVTYPRTDSLQNVVMVTDTMRFFYRPSSNELKAARELAKLREQGADTIPPAQLFMDIHATTGTSHDVYRPLTIESTTPWGEIDETKIRFTTTADSIWHNVEYTSLAPVAGQSILLRQIDFDVQPGQKYKFEVDSAAIYDIYGNPNKPFTHEFTAKTLESYSTLIFNVSPPDSNIVVELLDGSDKVIRTEHANAAGKAVFKYVNPGTFYARMYYDDNGDGKWTPGVVELMQQPEEVAYYPKKIDARANWDVDLTWDIYQIPLNTQKPYAILKNKPKLKKGEMAPTDGEEQEVDEWGNPIQRNNRLNNNNRNVNGINGMNGLQNLRPTNSGLLR